MFGELSKFLLNYFSVEPTEEYSAKDLEIFDKKHNYLQVVTEDDNEEDNKKEDEQKDD